jgi:putative endopeptidase
MPIRRSLSARVFGLLPVLGIASCLQAQAPAPAPLVPDPPVPAPVSQQTIKQLHGLDPTLRDTSVDPCSNFYQYACGGWLKQNPIPADESSYGRGTELEEQNRLVLKAILEKAAAGGSARSADEQKIGDFYATCMDTAAINERGLNGLKPMLAEISGLSSKDQLPPLVASLQQRGIPALFRFGSEQDFKDATQQIAAVDQVRLGLPERGYYLRTDAQSVALRKQYQEHVMHMFTLAGESPEQAAKDAQTVLDLETRLATASLSNEQRRDPKSLYHKTDLAAFRSQFSAFQLEPFLRSDDVSVDSLNVAVPAYFAGLNHLIAQTDLASLQTLLRWNLLHGTPGTALPAALDEEQFRFYGKTLSGQPEQQVRWKRCVRSVDGALGEALGRVYVEQRFPPQDKQRTLEMTRDIEGAMHSDLAQLSWMSAPTKARSEEKLAGVTNKIGYPDKWRDYSKLDITRGDALANAQRAAHFEKARDLAKIGKPVDKGEWEMSPPTVNAYYDPQMNDINFPAGILQPPYFDPAASDAVNYGDAGGVIGHELTHGFDDEGRQFDARGNFDDWWTPKDASEFNQRAACVVKEYDGFTAVDDLHVNGKLTLGENITDLGGLRLAYLAWMKREQQPGMPKETALAGMSPEQQFFVSYAQGWCQNNRPEDLRLRVQTDPHSPEEFRVNGVVVNLPEFQQAFSCKAGQPMVGPVVGKDRCSIW